jgi:hypothetical protein
VENNQRLDFFSRLGKGGGNPSRRAANKRAFSLSGCSVSIRAKAWVFIGLVDNEAHQLVLGNPAIVNPKPETLLESTCIQNITSLSLFLCVHPMSSGLK